MVVAKSAFGCSKKDSESKSNHIDLLGRYI
jgi:hypothetical protein